MIITVARQCGSGGDVIAKLLGKKYDIPVYGWKSTVEMAKKCGIYDENPTFFTEDAVNSLVFAITSFGNMDNVRSVPTKALAQVIGNQDCVLVGRCGNVIYRSRPDNVSVFLHGALSSRIAAMANVWKVSIEEAQERVPKTDEYRALYHKYYTGEQWGLSKYYDLTLDSHRLGFEKTAEMIEDYIDSIDLTRARSL